MGGQNEAGLGQKSQLYPPGGHSAVRAPSENDESLYVLDLTIFVFVLYGKHTRGNINLMLLYRNIFCS